MANFGNIDPFDPNTERFSEYEERLRFYLQANDVTNPEKERAILLTVIGPQQYKLLKDLIQPRALHEVTFSELCATLKKHYEPAPPMYLQRTLFEARVRHVDESPQTFIAELRKLAEHCQFGDQLEDRLCEKFIRSINDTQVQQKLLSKQKLTLTEAFDIAAATMATLSAAKSLQSPSNHTLHYTSKPNTHRFPNQQKQQSQPKPKPNMLSPCNRCGGPHASKSCKFINATCYKCNKPGHIAKVCRSTQHQRRQSHQINNQRPNRQHFGSRNHHLSSNTTGSSSSDSDNVSLFSLQSNGKPYVVNLSINKTAVDFQIDTGAALSVMTIDDFHRLPDAEIIKSNRILQTYTGQTVNVIGESHVRVDYNGNSYQLPLIVVEGQGPPLLGRNWLSHIKLNWNELFTLQPQSSNHRLQQLIEENNEAFGSDGLLKDHKVKIHLRPNSVPKYCKARQPPFALREGIEQELLRLETAGIIKKVKFSDWATPIVPVRKENGSIRICGDYKVTINKQIEEDRHPIPRTEELIAKLSGGDKFTRIDFSHAFTQLQLDDESKALTTINTHKGLYEYQRLCFGISSCPGIFQRTMESLFQHIENCAIYFDDLFITGKNDVEHLKALEEVLKICVDKGLKIRKEKCEFFSNEITFLGHKLNKNGLLPLPEKTRAIKDAPRPQNVHELKSFLGLINYYSQFINNLSQLLSPMYKLLRKNARWHWGREEEQAFKKCKDAISSDTILAHFDPSKPLVLTCDASPNGVGAVLSHVDDKGERPIAFASRSLNAAERNYSQLDREALSVIFGIRKYHKFIYGRHITINTDHKPLLGLLGESKSIPEHVSARMQRWAIILSGYQYELKYKPGAENNADALSRLPLKETACISIPQEVEDLFSFIDKLPISAEQIAVETNRDPLLLLVKRYTMHGWPEKVNESLRPFKSRQNEISIENNCLLWGTRVIIPQTFKSSVLSLLHDTHIGIARMKSQARSWVWWSNIDSDIEMHVKRCYECQLHAKQPTKAPLNPWDWPTEAWDRIHMDFAGPFMGKMFLIITDAHSKWIDVKIMTKITAQDTILELRDVFATMGLPKTIVTDNGPTFTSHEFGRFMTGNGVKHITVSPYHPSSNGLAERAVQTFKRAMIKISPGNVREKVCRFLTQYRNTPHSTTGLCPSELIFGRKTRTHLDLLHPGLQGHVDKQQTSQKSHHDATSSKRDIDVSDNVFVRNYDRNGDKWVPGIVIEKTGPLSFRIRTYSHGIVRRHQDQIRATACHFDEDTVIHQPDSAPPQDKTMPHRRCVGGSTPVPDIDISATENEDTAGEEEIKSDVPLRRSSRCVKPPDRLDL